MFGVAAVVVQKTVLIVQLNSLKTEEIGVNKDHFVNFLHPAYVSSAAVVRKVAANYQDIVVSAYVSSAAVVREVAANYQDIVVSAYVSSAAVVREVAATN